MFEADAFFDFMELGGPVVWILSVFSTVALTIIFVKLVQFIYWRAENQNHVEQALSAWGKGDVAQAVLKLNRKRVQDALVASAMKGIIDGDDETSLREELSRRAQSNIHQLRSYLKPLEIIAALSPLLGLLGTVLGMIAAFQQMEAAGSQVDPSILSGGIWQALLTTAAGISVAIPVLMAHNWMDRKVERIAHFYNDSVTRVFTHRPAPVNLDTQAQGQRDAA